MDTVMNGDAPPGTKEPEKLPRTEVDIVNPKQEQDDANELPISSLEPTKPAVPNDASNEPPTPKKVADLKRKSVSRASSSDRSSPAPSTKQSGSDVKKTGSQAASGKKGTASRKPAAKKRKLNGQDSLSVDGSTTPKGRSATPSSVAGKASASKNRKQSSLSAAGSPAPEKKSTLKGEVPDEDEMDDDDEDSSEIFCICRKPDNHTWMIGCDGPCEDWFHGKCVNINQEDADLIDKYICAACEEKTGAHTTWKPMCRLPGCRQPARVTRMIPSKYCSDEHGREFMLQKTKLAKNSTSQSHSTASRAGSSNKTRGYAVAANKKGPKASQPDVDMNGADDDEEDEDEDDVDAEEEAEAGQVDMGSRGGILTGGELKAIVSGVKSAEEFRKLGESVLPVPAEKQNESPNGAPTKSGEVDFDFDHEAHNVKFTAKEQEKLEVLRNRKATFRSQLDLLKDRDTFLALVRQRAKTVLERLRQAEPKAGWKDICGFDSRLSWSEEEFNEWRQSDAGKKALKDGVLEAPAVDGDGDADMDGIGDEDSVEKISRGVCTKKRCERHKQWHRVQKEDIQHDQNVIKQDLTKCEGEAKDLVERVVMRQYGNGVGDGHHE